MAPGKMDAQDTPKIQALMQQLRSASVHVENEGELPAAINQALKPDLDIHAASGSIGFLHRHLPDAEIYFACEHHRAGSDVASAHRQQL